MRLFAAVMCAVFAALPAASQDAQQIKSAVIRIDQETVNVTSRLDLPPDDLGFAGAALAVDDNQTTGRFMGQEFINEEIAVFDPADAGEALERLIAEGTLFIVTMADAETTLALADQAGDRALLVNASARETVLRDTQCRRNLLHVAPSTAMIADALAQFAAVKRWDEWFLIEGSNPADTELADAYRRAANKFGIEIVETRVFEDTGGARRTDTGFVQVQRQMPVFTQSAPDHDLVVAADASDYFASNLQYHTWEARPVAGSAGLKPESWHPAQEAWGATQFQNRFEVLARRYMRDEDFQVWAALRVLGEAATRTQSADFNVLRDYILGPDFELAAFKGQKLTFRPWNGQLRQPVILTADNVMVTSSPQDQFLHRVSRLDTLGLDEPESSCNFNE